MGWDGCSVFEIEGRSAGHKGEARVSVPRSFVDRGSRGVNSGGRIDRMTGAKDDRKMEPGERGRGSKGRDEQGSVSGRGRVDDSGGRLERAAPGEPEVLGVGPRSPLSTRPPMRLVVSWQLTQ